MPDNRQLTGILIVSAGVFIFSFDAVLVRLAGTSGPDVAFWRGVFIAMSFALVLSGRRLVTSCLTRTGPASAESGLLCSFYRAGGTLLLLAGFFHGFSSFLFALSVFHTTAANALVLFSTIPLLSAILSRIFLKEPITRRTLIAIFCVLAGVGCIVADSFQGGTLSGNLMAGTAAFCFSCFLVLLRRYPHINKAGAIMWGGVVTALAAWPLAVQPFGLTQEGYLWLVLLGGVVLPLSVLLMTTGTRYITAAEVGLLMTADSILGSLWVYLVFQEPPSLMTLAGGGIIIVTLIFHFLQGLDRQPA